MSYTWLSTKAVKVRKPHGCAWCGQRVNAGEMAQYRTYVFDGDFQSDYMHPECNQAMHDYPDQEELMDGWTPGDFERPGLGSAESEGERG